ncbi:PepSY domain-containing protein [Novosphingobium sp. Rr 2-17]|uniref:PepSY domain-containing protein n=1 Tax=Novosphingobium sp. Rr 2-17 TaxID=555793 RepID=UPI003FD59A2D
MFNAVELGTDTVMKRFPVLAALALATIAVPSTLTHAQPGGGEQGEVRRGLRAGNLRPVREIEREILPRMGGMQYLGPEYDPVAMTYRLKFIDNGRVHFVDVDARTGRIIGESR